MENPIAALPARTKIARVGGGVADVCRAAFVILPALLMWFLAGANRVNTLFLDDWAYVPLYEKAVRGGLTLHDFFGGYLEHRPAIARAIAIVTTLLSKGDVRWQCIVAFFAVFTTWVNCGLLLRRALGGWRPGWLVWGLMGWVLFCPVQWQEFLWPSCHMDTLPLLFLTSSFLVLGREKLSPWLRLALCAVFAWISTYSFAAGLSLWVLVPLAVGCGYGFPEVPSRWRFALVWLVPAAVVLFCYFHGLKNEMERQFAYGQGHEDTMTHSVVAVLSSPGRGIKFALTLAGSNLARGILGQRSLVALAMGVVGCGIFGLGVWVFGSRWKQVVERRATLPLFFIAFYGLCVAGMIASGRAWASKDVGGALNNRYACFSSAFVAGLVGLVGVLAARGQGNRSGGTGLPVLPAQSWLGRAALPLGGVLCGLLTANWVYGANMMDAWRDSRLRGAADIHLSPVLGLAQDRGQPTQHIRLAYARAAMMNDLGFLHPPLATGAALSQFVIKPEGLSERLGRITSTQETPEALIIRGVTLLTLLGRPADGILITCDDGTSQGRQIVDLALPDDLPSFFGAATTKDWQYIVADEDRAQRFGKWQSSIPSEKLPHGPNLRIEAWALNYGNMTVRQVGGSFTIHHPPGEPVK